MPSILRSASRPHPRHAGALVLLCFAAPALAQQQSSTLQSPAQQVQRYYDQQKLPAEKPADPLKQPAPAQPNAALLPEGQHFLLKEVHFTPSELLPKEALDAAVKPYLGKTMDGKELAHLLDDVNALYAARKITTARAVLTSQTIEDGVLNVELVEGRLGKIDIRGTRHVHDRFIRRRISQRENEVVDSDRLRDELVYLNRTTDLQVRALLQPGAQRGQTDIALQVAEPDRHSFDVFADNNGVDSTGRLRIGAQAQLFGLLGVDDRLEGNIAHSRGGNDGALSYSIPVDPWNGRLGLNVSHSKINVINGAFQQLEITGQSTVYGIELNQPFVATRDWLLSGVGSYSIGDSKTDISGQHIADTRTRLITLGGSLQHQSDHRRWGFTQLYTRINSSEPMLGKTNFNTFPGNAFYLQRLGDSKWALRGNLGWQFSTGKNIPSANLFQIGGIGSVRGYERGVISGPRGYYAALELHRVQSERLDIYGFADHGAISGFYPKSLGITGVGVGALYRYRDWLTLSGDVAKPIDTVVPDQSGIRADLRIAIHWR
ncbi:MAG: ShlB/FhaC/HecB family hemolysin secretion/activation protein [Proteobacteria bacterium]|nr:ShlB/FhaC/HecB family hemolysin secretion/activation protein [Pseudomonadota bacterium]